MSIGLNNHLNCLAAVKHSHYSFCGKRDDDSFITDHAKNCFAQIKEDQSRLGYMHWIKKHIISRGVYGVSLAAPPAILCGGLSYACCHYPDQTAKFAGDVVTSSWNGFYAAGEAVVGHVGKLAGYGSATAAVAVGAYFHRTIADALVKGFWSSLGALAYADFQFAKMNYDSFYESCLRKEDDIKKKIDSTHKGLVVHLQKQFDADANDLEARYNAAKNNPKKMYELKQFIDAIMKNWKAIQKSLVQLELSPAEASQALNKLSTTIKHLQNTEFSLQSGTSAAVQDFNAGILTTWPVSKKTCLTPEALKKIQTAKDNSWTFGDTLGGALGTASVSGLGGASGVIAGALALGAATYAQIKLEDPMLLIKIGGAAGLALGGLAGTKWTLQEKRQKDAVATANNREAVENITQSYNGVSAHLLRKEQAAARNNSVKKELNEQVSTLESRLSKIQAEIRKSGIRGISAEDLTGQLKATLVAIRGSTAVSAA